MKRVVLLQKVVQVVMAGLVAIALLSPTAVVNAAEEKEDDRWHFSVTPYVWLPSVSAKLNPGLSSIGQDVNVAPNNYLSSLQFAGFLDLQVDKGRWSLLVDLMYIDFSDNNRKAAFFTNLPGGGLKATADTGLNAFVGEAVIGYAVYRTKSIDFEVIGGARYASVEGKIDLNVAGPLPEGFRSANVSKRKDFLDPVVGVKGQFELGKKWYIPYYFDIGGFGVSSDWTSQGFAGIGYHFTDLFSMVLGYKYLYYDFGDKNLKDMWLNGVALGFVFTF